jgi:hypothetical protein
MRENMWRKAGFAAVIVAAAGMVIGSNPLSSGQDAKEKKAKGRLPAYYADIVNDDQKTKIYAIQSKYAKKLESLNEQLLEVTKQQNSEIEDVLTADQKEKVKKAQEEGTAKKKKAAADKKAAEEPKSTPAPETKKVSTAEKKAK